jgi:hypothetical protein
VEQEECQGHQDSVGDQGRDEAFVPGQVCSRSSLFQVKLDRRNRLSYLTMFVQ